MSRSVRRAVLAIALVLSVGGLDAQTWQGQGRASGGGIGDIDGIGEAAQRFGALEQSIGGGAQRWRDLRGDDEISALQFVL